MYEESPVRAIGYCRVASNGPDTDKKFCEQEHLIVRYSGFQNLEFTNCFYETGQPGEELMSAYGYCQEKGDIAYLLVSDIERLARNQNACRAWIDKFLELGVEVQVAFGPNASRRQLRNTHFN